MGGHTVLKSKQVAEDKEIDLKKELFKSPETSTRSSLLPAFNANLPSHLPTPQSPNNFANYITQQSDSPSSVSLEHAKDTLLCYKSSHPSPQTPQRTGPSIAGKHRAHIFLSEGELGGSSRLVESHTSQIATPSPEVDRNLPMPSSPSSSSIIQTPQLERTEKHSTIPYHYDTSPSTAKVYHPSAELPRFSGDPDDPFIVVKNGPDSHRLLHAHKSPSPSIPGRDASVNTTGTLDGSVAKLFTLQGGSSDTKMDVDEEQKEQGYMDADGEEDNAQGEVDHDRMEVDERENTSQRLLRRTPPGPKNAADGTSTPYIACASRVRTPLVLDSYTSTPTALGISRCQSPDVFNSVQGFARTPFRTPLAQEGLAVLPRLPSTSPFNRSPSPSHEDVQAVVSEPAPKTPPRKMAMSQSPLRNGKASRTSSPTAVVAHVHDIQVAPSPRTSPPLITADPAARTPSPVPGTSHPPGGEIARIRHHQAALASARATASEPGRPEYFVRVKRTREDAAGDGGTETDADADAAMEEEGKVREDVALGVTITPSRGRRLKLYHPVPIVATAGPGTVGGRSGINVLDATSQGVTIASVVDGVDVGGVVLPDATDTEPATPPPLLPVMDLRAIDWRTPRDSILPSSPSATAAVAEEAGAVAAPGPAISIKSAEEMEKKERRLDAFRATKASDKGKSLRVVEAEGRGRIIVDPTKPDVFGLMESGILPEISNFDDKAHVPESYSPYDPFQPSSTHNDNSPMIDGPPQWPDTHFPWSLQTQQLLEAQEAERARRLKWIEQFFERESSSEEDDYMMDSDGRRVMVTKREGPVVYESESEGGGGGGGGRVFPVRNRGGRGKTVILRADPNTQAVHAQSAPPSSSKPQKGMPTITPSSPTPPSSRKKRSKSKINNKRSSSKAKAKAKAERVPMPPPLPAFMLTPQRLGRIPRRLLFAASTSDALQVLLSKKRVRKIAYRVHLRQLEEEEEGVVMCICQRGDDGRAMVRCDACRVWYHLVCMDISDEDELGEEWFCFKCVEGAPEEDVGEPSWAAQSSASVVGEREGESEGQDGGAEVKKKSASRKKGTGKGRGRGRVVKEEKQQQRVPTFAPNRPVSPVRADLGDQPLYQAPPHHRVPFRQRTPKGSRHQSHRSGGGSLQPSPILASPTRRGGGKGRPADPNTPIGYSYGSEMLSTPRGGGSVYDESYVPFDPTSTPSRGLKFPAGAAGNGPFATPGGPHIPTGRLGTATWSTSSNASSGGTAPGPESTAGGGSSGAGRYAGMGVLDEAWGGGDESPVRRQAPAAAQDNASEKFRDEDLTFGEESPVRRSSNGIGMAGTGRVKETIPLFPFPFDSPVRKSSGRSVFDSPVRKSSSLLSTPIFDTPVRPRSAVSLFPSLLGLDTPTRRADKDKDKERDFIFESPVFATSSTSRGSSSKSASATSTTTATGFTRRAVPDSPLAGRGAASGGDDAVGARGQGKLAGEETKEQEVQSGK